MPSKKKELRPNEIMVLTDGVEIISADVIDFSDKVILVTLNKSDYTYSQIQDLIVKMKEKTKCLDVMVAGPGADIAVLDEPRLNQVHLQRIPPEVDFPHATCKVCNGAKVRQKTGTFYPGIPEYELCPECKGSGVNKDAMGTRDWQILAERHKKNEITYRKGGVLADRETPQATDIVIEGYVPDIEVKCEQCKGHGFFDINGKPSGMGNIKCGSCNGKGTVTIKGGQ